MKPFAVLLRRVLTAALVLLPPLAGTDLCTVGALTGRTDLMCGGERTARACHAQPAPPACPHCVPDEPAPTPEPAPSNGPTCCDLKPQAAGAAEAPAPDAPVPAAHPVAAIADRVGVPPAPTVAHVTSDADRAPPGESLPPLSPRPPPLG